jgi:hypothetical protein
MTSNPSIRSLATMGSSQPPLASMPIRRTACSASPSDESRMAVGIIVSLEAPGMAIDRHVELAPSGIVLSLAKDRRKQEETFSSSTTLPWECEPDVQATTRVRRRAEGDLAAPRPTRLRMRRSGPSASGPGGHEGRTFFTKQANSTGNR